MRRLARASSSVLRGLYAASTSVSITSRARSARAMVGTISLLPDVGITVHEMKPIDKDLAAVNAAYQCFAEIDGFHPYLEEERMIPAHIITDPIFAGRIRADRYGNAIFPHYNRDGVCGYESKGPNGWTRFATGGEKGLFGSHIQTDDNKLVIAETAIDALSYAALKGTSSTRFYSTGGALSPKQPAYIKLAFGRLPEGAQIILAMDNDAGGRNLGEQITGLFSSIEPRGCVLTIDVPEQEGQDWNDVLRASRGRQTANSSKSPRQKDDGPRSAWCVAAQQRRLKL